MAFGTAFGEDFDQFDGLMACGRLSVSLEADFG